MLHCAPISRSKVKVTSSHRLYVSSLPLLNSGNKLLCLCHQRQARAYRVGRHFLFHIFRALYRQRRLQQLCILLQLLFCFHTSIIQTSSRRISVDAYAYIEGDHLSGKPRNVREFYSCQGMSGILLKVLEVSRKNLVREKWPKTVYCQLHICICFLDFAEIVHCMLVLDHAQLHSQPHH